MLISYKLGFPDRDRFEESGICAANDEGCWWPPHRAESHSAMQRHLFVLRVR
jgi:hypothetical protein